jgi:hypothetical protein
MLVHPKQGVHTHFGQSVSVCLDCPCSGNNVSFEPWIIAGRNSNSSPACTLTRWSRFWGEWLTASGRLGPAAQLQSSTLQPIIYITCPAFLLTWRAVSGYCTWWPHGLGMCYRICKGVVGLIFITPLSFSCQCQFNTSLKTIRNPHFPVPNFPVIDS